MAACTCGGTDCLRRDVVGDKEFNKKVNEIIDSNIRSMRTSRNALLKQGIDALFIVYVVKNWEDNNGGIWYKMNKALEQIRSLKEVKVAHHYGKGRDGYMCLCLDGRDIVSLQQTIHSDKKSWTYHSKRMSI